MEEKMLKISFSYTDEFGQESLTTKTLTTACIEDYSDFELLVDEFKLFLRASGFSEDLVNTIKIIEDLETLL